jgi:hypothetical protein
VGEVLEMSDDELLKIRNFGEKSLVELQEKLAEHGITSPTEGGDFGGDASGVGVITSDDLTELMGGGDEGDPGSLPAGMTFEEDSLLASDEKSDDDGLDYEEME